MIAISLGRKFFKTTILGNNIIQTTGSAGESIAAGVVFYTARFSVPVGPPARLFQLYHHHDHCHVRRYAGHPDDGTLRRSLIVKRTDTLPYPEGNGLRLDVEAGERRRPGKDRLHRNGFAPPAILQKDVSRDL